MPGDGAEREAAVSDIERKVDAFRAEQEKTAQKQMATIRQAEDSKIQKLSDALGKLQLAPADRPGLPEGVVLRVQNLCMYFGGVHAVDGLSFDVKRVKFSASSVPTVQVKPLCSTVSPSFISLPPAHCCLKQGRRGHLLAGGKGTRCGAAGYRPHLSECGGDSGGLRTG